MTYKIVHKDKDKDKDKDRHILFAAGFYSLERAEKWIALYNAQNYMDKTIKREDLMIVEDKHSS